MGPVWYAKTVVDTVKLLDTLGLVKSVLIPSQKLVFIIDSVSTLVNLTPEKALKLKQGATDLFNCKTPTIREVAKVLGLTVSFSRVYSYVTRMYSRVLVYYSHVFVCYSYVTRMYSFVPRMYSCVLVCYSHVLVWCFSHDNQLPPRR